MTLKPLVIALALSVSSTGFTQEAADDGQSQNDSTWYAGGTFGQIRLDGSGTSLGDIEHLLAGINFGYKANDYLSLEGRIGTGSEERGSIYEGNVYTPVDFKLDHYYGVYALLTLPISDTVSPYFIVGKAWTEYSASVKDFSFSEKSDNTTYGIGFNFSVSDEADLRLEYLDWDDDVESFGFSLLGRF